jgi:hypothetical protein
LEGKGRGDEARRRGRGTQKEGEKIRLTFLLLDKWKLVKKEKRKEEREDSLEI